MLRDNFERETMLHHLNIGMSQHFRRKRALDLVTGRIFVVKDTFARMPAFFHEVKSPVGFFVKFGTQLHKVVDAFLGPIDDYIHNVFVADIASARQRIAFMLDLVTRVVYNASDTALRETRIGLKDIRLA